MKFNALLLAGAAALSLGVFAAGSAHADTIYTTSNVAPGATVTTTSGQETVHQTYTAVGTRKVGLVGYHPYPMKASHVETSTVRVSEPQTTVITAPGSANVASSTSVTTTSTNDQPINYSTGGGTYYTEDGTAYYRDESLNIRVRRTGSLND